MRVLFSPQLNNKYEFEYVFNGDLIIATLKDAHGTEIGKDHFDFTGMVDGRLSSVETTLPIRPIIHASKENGVLSVELFKFIDYGATHEEKFPKWKDV